MIKFVYRHFENSPDARVVYVVPNEDLATKVYEDWSDRLGKLLEKTVVMLTGEPTLDQKLLAKGT